MAFDKLEKQMIHGRANSVRVSNAGKNAQLKISMSYDVASAIGIGVGDKVDVYIGKLQDAGKVAVMKSANGSGYAVYKNGGAKSGTKALCFGFSARNAGLQAPEKTREAPFTIENDTLIVNVTAI